MQGARIIAKLLLLSLKEDGNELLDAVMSVLDSYENKSKTIEENVCTRLILEGMEIDVSKPPVNMRLP